MARKTGSESEFGARLDTIADMIFVVVCFTKLIPVLEIDRWVYIWIAIIEAIKIINSFLQFRRNDGEKTNYKLDAVLILTTGCIEVNKSMLLGLHRQNG